MARIFREDAYSIGLLYAYTYSNNRQILLSKKALDDFYNCMEYHLKELGEKELSIYARLYDEEIYRYSQDENGNEYIMLKDGFNYEKAVSDFLGIVPINYIIASQKASSLSALGLVQINRKIQLKRNILKTKCEGDNCANCDRAISWDLKKTIQRENYEYKDLSDSELDEEISSCELGKTKEEITALSYWCPEYLPTEERIEEKKRQLKK